MAPLNRIYCFLPGLLIDDLLGTSLALLHEHLVASTNFSAWLQYRLAVFFQKTKLTKLKDVVLDSTHCRDADDTEQ